MKKEHNVVILPTKDTTDIVFRENKGSGEVSIYQHLCITSDEEIKEGDWYLDTTLIPKNNLDDLEYELIGKIIATTDSSLKMPINKHLIRLEEADERDETFLLPKIPESFIKAFVKADGKIDKILVEYEEKLICTEGEDCPTFTNSDAKCKGEVLEISRLKLRDDGTIHIHNATKQHYTREEVLKLKDLANAIINPACEILPDTYNDELANYFDWIKNNL